MSSPKIKSEQVSDAKALQEDLASSGFSPSLAKPEIQKKVGRRRVSSYEDKAK